METTITRISRTRKGRFALFCDAGFLFSVDEETFFTEHLAEGLTLDDGQLDELLRKSDAQRAKDKGIATVVFDRGGYVYHGRVAALAEGAREGGLKF